MAAQATSVNGKIVTHSDIANVLPGSILDANTTITIDTSISLSPASLPEKTPMARMMVAVTAALWRLSRHRTPMRASVKGTRRESSAH